MPTGLLRRINVSGPDSWCMCAYGLVGSIVLPSEGAAQDQDQDEGDAFAPDESERLNPFGNSCSSIPAEPQKKPPCTNKHSLVRQTMQRTSRWQQRCFGTPSLILHTVRIVLFSFMKGTNTHPLVQRVVNRVSCSNQGMISPHFRP